MFDKGSTSNVRTTFPEASANVIKSPALLIFICPSEAVCTNAPPKLPVGVPPPNKTNTSLGCKIVPAGKVCLNSAASEMV